MSEFWPVARQMRMHEVGTREMQGEQSTVNRLSLILILLLPLIYTAATAQELRMPANPDSPSIRAGTDGSAATRNFHLKGVLVSQSGGLALINGKTSEVGDRVAGAEIVAIMEGAVRILVGSREVTVYVGSSFDPRQSFHSSTGRSQVATRPRSLRAAPVSTARPTNPRRTDQHTVASGETLSGISERYRLSGVTLNQTMIAVFRANPQAFSGNINILHRGATLRLPTRDELLAESHGTATARVTSQLAEWRAGAGAATQLAEAASPARNDPIRYGPTQYDPTRYNPKQYGPVRRGETLFEIAERVLPAGVTTDQMMIALLQENPAAFGNNINVLYEGATLRIPGHTQLQQYLPEYAATEVIRQTDAWRAGDRRPTRSMPPYVDITASNREFRRGRYDALP